MTYSDTEYIVGSINGSALNKLIQQVYQRNLVLFLMLFNIVKVSFILTIRNGSFSRWLPRAIIVDIQLFNLERCSWCLIVGFNTTNAYTGIASGNASPKTGKIRRVTLRESISFENCRYPSTIQPRRDGALVESITLNRRVVGSTPALAVTLGPWASPLPTVACALRRETPIQCPCCSRERR